jgi:hypothetical protein
MSNKKLFVDNPVVIVMGSSPLIILICKEIPDFKKKTKL